MTLVNSTGSRIAVGMSGGVDSAVAALLLRERGYRVEGVFMQNWEEEDADQCTAQQDYRDALAVCSHLGIRLRAVNFAAEYWERVFSHFLDEYAAGRTPNPDILCNREIKFRAFLDHALANGAEAIATGHYARIGEAANGGARLLRGVDANKDQSYFLHALGQDQLSHSLFPLGELEKPAVRQLARDAGLHNHARRDSTGICFIGERRFANFLAEYLPARPGEMRSAEGELLGEHRGLMFYTLGQRQGLGLGGRSGGDAAPWYVLDKDLDNNALIVGQGHDHPRLFRDQLRAQQLSWCAGRAPGELFECTAKVRYRQADQHCTLRLDADAAEVRFDEPQRAVTPGQSIVFYAGEVCLGGGTIA